MNGDAGLPSDPVYADSTCVLCRGPLDEGRPVMLGFRVRFCRDCGLGQLRPRPTPEQIEALYSESYFTHEAVGGDSGYADYGSMEREHVLMAKLLLPRIAAFRAPPGRLFDIGCGFGHFLQAAQEAGWTVAGSDISAAAIEHARTRTSGVRVQRAEEISGPYDVITAWDVIEHVEDPHVALTRIRDALVPGGIFAMSTPDTDSWDARLLGGRWYGYTKVPEHLLYFNRSSVARAFRMAGLELVRSQQWGFIRSLDFLARKAGAALTGEGGGLLGSLARPAARTALFVPAIDMLVIAQRPT